MIIPSKHSGYGEGGRLTSTRRVYDGGGGGGGTQTSISDLPDWAKPTAQNILGSAESTVFTKDADNKVTGLQPYQTYGGERSAQFTDLQKAAYGNAAGLNAGPQGFAQNVGQYMSPYQQNVIDREKMEAARTSQMLGQEQQAKATQSGAFGGYREGIQRAERERGLRSQMQDIQTRGSQAAYDRAADQFRSGITQQLAVGQQQNQLGTQQQQQIQGMMDQRYQDFLNQQKYPYQQLGYLSDILRGTPMGGTQTLYGSSPSMGQTLGSLGMGAYGLSKLGLFAEGGSVTSDQNVEGILDNLSDAQLRQSRQIAVANGDRARVEMIDDELAQRASEKNGMSAAFNSLPQEQQAGVISAAGGGILAFAGDDDDNDPETGQLVSASYAPGSPADYQYFLNRGKKLFEQMDEAPEYKAMTPEEQARARAAYIKETQEGAGESPYAKRLEGINAERAALSGNLEQAKGIGALRAAAAMLQGRGLMRGLGGAGEAFASTYEKAEAANRSENRALKDMEFNLLDAQRKERMGLNKEATAAMREVERDRTAAAKFRKDGLAAQANLARGMAAATKPQRPTGSKPLKLNEKEQLAAAEIAYERDPSEANLKTVTALRRAVAQTRTSDVGPTRATVDSFRTESTADTEIEKQMRSARFSDPAWMRAYEAGNVQAQAAAEDDIVRRIRARRQAAAPQVGAPAAPAAPASAPRVNANSPQTAPVRLRFDSQGNSIP
jgi:hypothetical protein